MLPVAPRTRQVDGAGWAALSALGMGPSQLQNDAHQIVDAFGRACQAAGQAPLWAIVGPTASGKSDVAMDLAWALGAEIISADAVAVYKGCTIGSAQPSAQDRARVPHHLIDCTEPDAPFDANLFVQGAEAAIHDIRSRGRVPLICGGTGLYVRALRQGLIDVPKSSSLRAALEAEDERRPGTSLKRLQQLDPKSAQMIDPHNGAYVRRALEITLITQQPASALRAKHAAKPPRHPILLWWVDRGDAELRQRMEARTHAMLEGGLIEEVENLLSAGVSPTCNALRSVGYGEVVAMLSGSLARQDLHRAIVKSTWQYARRQRIWLRREQKQASHLVGPLMLTDLEKTAAGSPFMTNAPIQWLKALWHQGSLPPPSAC